MTRFQTTRRLLAVTLLVLASGASAQELYLANRDNPTDLYRVDLGTTSTATLLISFSQGSALHAIGLTPDGKTLVRSQEEVLDQMPEVAVRQPAKIWSSLLQAPPKVAPDAVGRRSPPEATNQHRLGQ